ncbi:Rhomboid family protein [Stigmatella aurantiaca]|uniref:Rhomboid family protein n=1 Tax=Stigmatella aurantiaca TaxID=41 RepID=A0A1H7T1W4_STIAU|nr:MULTISPECIES: rhomboid family intramembrane serine protease [Stigmatella]SEL78708.1 Rhomboid family protein [Stigmatella aurantiaca]
MRPMRGSGGGFGGGGGGFSGLESTAAKLALALVAGSVMFLLTRNAQGGLLLLVPGTLGSFLWQPFTYAFIETSPLGILFGALIIWSIGGWLEATWGTRKFLLVGLGCTVAAGFLTTAITTFLVPVAAIYPGGTVLTSVLWVAYGLTIGKGQANFWGIPLSGNALAGIGAGFVFLSVLTSGGGPVEGLLRQLPEVIGLVLIFVYVRGASPRRLLLHFQHWKLQRQLRNRSRNMRVVREERSDDQYLN